MWVEETKNGKFRLYERYIDPLTNKKRKASVLMDKNTAQAINKARPLLLAKIADKTNIELLNSNDITLGQLQNEFIEMKAASLSPASLTSYRFALGRLVDSIGDDAIVENITTRMLQQYFTNLSAKYKLSSIRLYATNIKTMFQYAINTEYIKSNPMDNVILSSRVKTVTNDDDKYLSARERTELLDVAYEVNIRYALLIEWLLNSGMRISEAIGLQYNKIHGDIVRIDEQYQNKRLVPLKTESSIRQIKMTRRMKEIVEKEREMNEPISNHDFIFVGTSGEPILADSFAKFLRRLSKRLSFDKPIHAHMFRHTHISILAENNVNVKAIMKRVGHASPEITMDIYTHVTERMNRDLGDKLDDIF